MSSRKPEPLLDPTSENRPAVDTAPGPDPNGGPGERGPAPRSTVILGSGRSGTSMVAGLLRRSGYFMGDSLWRARDANPKGFFEDREINWLNERLLAPLVPSDLPGPLGRYEFRFLGRFRRWLAHVEPGTALPELSRVERRIARLTSRRPFAFKDPRFCYTLPAWRPHLGDAAFLCVFREPGRTATSIARELATASYLRGVKMTRDEILAVWNAMYRHVLDHHRHAGDWLFVHYDQVLAGPGLDAIEQFLGATPDRDFPDSTLKRSSISAEALPARVVATYEELCGLAGVPL